MAIRRDSLTMKLAAALLAFVAVFLGVRALDGGSASLTGQPEVAVREGELPGATTAQRIEGLQAQVREAPSDPDAYAQLGLAYLQQVRETGDPTFYPRAQGTFEQAAAARSRETSPPPAASVRSPWPATTSAAHSHSASGPPGSTRTWPATTGSSPTPRSSSGATGRRSARSSTTSTSSRSSPRTPGSPTSVSCTAICPGRSAAMRLAVSAGGGTAENVSYVQALVGKLHFDSGDYAGGGGRLPDGARDGPGLPRRDGGPGPGRGCARATIDAAIRRLRALVLRLPLPEYVIALGETEQAAGIDGGRRARLPAGRGRDPAPPGERGQHRRRAGPLRGRPRRPGAGGGPGGARLGGGAERPLGRRATRGR